FMKVKQNDAAKQRWHTFPRSRQYPELTNTVRGHVIARAHSDHRRRARGAPPLDHMVPWLGYEPVIAAVRPARIILTGLTMAYAAFRLGYHGGASTCSSFSPAIKTLEMPCRSTSRVVVSGGQCACATSFQVATDRGEIASAIVSLAS